MPGSDGSSLRPRAIQPQAGPNRRRLSAMSARLWIATIEPGSRRKSRRESARPSRRSPRSSAMRAARRSTSASSGRVCSTSGPKRAWSAFSARSARPTVSSAPTTSIRSTRSEGAPRASSSLTSSPRASSLNPRARPTRAASVASPGMSAESRLATSVCRSARTRSARRRMARASSRWRRGLDGSTRASCSRIWIASGTRLQARWMRAASSAAGDGTPPRRNSSARSGPVSAGRSASSSTRASSVRAPPSEGPSAIARRKQCSARLRSPRASRLRAISRCAVAGFLIESSAM